MLLILLYGDSGPELQDELANGRDVPVQARTLARRKQKSRFGEKRLFRLTTITSRTRGIRGKPWLVRCTNGAA
jgi:hypothetical protein